MVSRGAHPAQLMLYHHKLNAAVHRAFDDIIESSKPLRLPFSLVIPFASPGCHTML